MTLKLAIIANPIAGGGRDFKRIQRHLKAWPHADWEPELFPTKCAEHAGVLARDMLDRPPDLLAVCGGDGTLNEVISSVPEPPFPVAIIPAGTANVLMREVGMPRDPIRALEVALKRVVRRVDLGVLRGRKQQHFLLMAGIGFDAYIVSKVRQHVKKRLGVASYYAATLHALLSYPFPEFRVVADGESFHTVSCLIANSRSYGGGLVFAPKADMSDGLLDVIIVDRKPRISHCRFLLSAWLGRPRFDSCVRYLRVPALKIEGPPLWVQADGELVGSLPMEVSLARSAFPLVVPGEPIPHE